MRFPVAPFCLGFLYLAQKREYINPGFLFSWKSNLHIPLRDLLRDLTAFQAFKVSHKDVRFSVNFRNLGGNKRGCFDFSRWF